MSEEQAIGDRLRTGLDIIRIIRDIDWDRLQDIAAQVRSVVDAILGLLRDWRAGQASALADQADAICAAVQQCLTDDTGAETVAVPAGAESQSFMTIVGIVLEIIRMIRDFRRMVNQ